MAHNDAVARPYARAVFELAREEGRLEGWSALLQTAAAVVEDPEMAAVLNAPFVDGDRVAALIADICSQDPQAAELAGTSEARNLLRLLAENRRFGALRDISAAFEHLKAEAENVVDVVLTAANPVDDALQARIAEALKRRFGRDVRLRFELDKELIGGARLQADDHVIDGSVRTGLEKLASVLVH